MTGQSTITKSQLIASLEVEHDLRRPMRSRITDLDIDPGVAEKCLNHSLGRIEKTYNRSKMETQRKAALTIWNEYVQQLVNPANDWGVVSSSHLRAVK